MKSQKSADQDLDAQQQHLATQNYDLRITNLARFIYSKIQKHLRHPELDSGSHEIPGQARNDNNSPSKKIKLLDVGAGNGLFLKFFKDHGFEVSGIELEKELVQNMKNDPSLKGISIKQGDITQLKGSEQYDVVIASDVIEHIEDDFTAVQNLWSFVAPGGMLIITVPAHSFLYGKRDVAWGHFRRYDKSLLVDRAKSVKDGSISFVTFWNTLGFFAYYLYERILQRPINEKMRYSDSTISKMLKSFLDMKLRFEEKIGGTPIGLTLIIGVKKS